jgi:S-DNA-T family DNA segregation ATPase FtsK/SpoIIIE
VTFLFVDYKGGAAFADCVDLPHCVGLVTDLSPHLVRRALASLRAELRHREHLLAAAGAKDLLAMERAGDPRTPPALVIVIDEFAALVQEVPEFVDGVVDVAQRGRSLGLHLILATQRPAGVIKDNLRANTNLRIALRMADEHDSTDVLGSAMAAQFDPRVPGRGAVRTGPGRLAMFQTGYVGGRSDAAPAAPAVSIETLTFGPGEVWDVPAAVDPGAGSAEGPTDAARLVRTLGAAAQVARVPAPRRPWLPELPTVVPLDLAGTHPDGALPVGLVDVPAEQAQVPFVYRPDEDGSVVAFGTSGAGKSTFLRSVAVSAATARGHVRLYGLDFAGGALSVLDALPQVGSIVPGGDSERVVRIVTDLVALLDARAVAFAAARAATLAEYRTLTGTDEPRVLLLVDGLAAFRDAFEQDTQGMKAVAGFARLLAEGRPLGVHVVMSAERPHALSTSMAASVATRIVMRQSDENAAVQLGIARDALGDDPAAGRAVLAGGTDELQIAVPGGGADIATQAGVIDQIAAALHAAGTPQAPAVRRLEAIIPVASLPDAVGGDPVLGIADSTLEAIGFDRRGTLMVAGMTGSGRTTTLVALAHALRRHLPDAPVYYIGPRRSPAAQAPCWTRTAHRTPEVAELLAEVQPLLDQSADDIPPVTLVVEALTDLAATEVEMPLAAAVRAAKRNGHLVIGEAETTTWASISPPVAELRKARRGLVLQPTQDDGGALMGVTFPRLTTADFPPGRGLYVAAGRMHRVQVPLPPG